MNDRDSLYETLCNDQSIRERYRNAANKFGRLAVGRKWYFDHLQEIMDLSNTDPRQFLDIYPFDWRSNKNESGLWMSIRQHNVVFYPEFPIFDRYFDFANPYFKIALEADSAKFHDSIKDIHRDRVHYEFGWITFRLSYQETQTTTRSLGEILEDHDDYDEVVDEIEKIMLSSSCGVVKAIDYFYFMDDVGRERRDAKIPDFKFLAEETLCNHTSLPEDAVKHHLRRHWR